MIELIAQKSDIRLDVFLSEAIPEFSRAKIQEIIKAKGTTVNGKIGKASYNVQIGDKITFEPPKEKNIEILPENIKLDVRYEDEDILVINKPKNMLTHPTETETSGTLVNALLYNYRTLSDINGKMRPGIVHRLDRDTSGLILVAKTNKGHLHLEKQIRIKLQ